MKIDQVSRELFFHIIYLLFKYNIKPGEVAQDALDPLELELQ